MNKNSKIILLVVVIIVIAAFIGCFVLYKKNYLPVLNSSNQNWLQGKDKNLPKKDAIIQPLPSNASTVRLNLPTSIGNLMITNKKGLGGLGVETDDPTVYNYVYMDIKQGTEINSLASGKVTKIDRKGLSEYEITLNFSYGLWGRYLAIQKPLVKEGDLVREGQPIGTGLIGSQPSSSILAFSIADENITEGTKSSFSQGMIVEPLNYLKPDVKAIILSKYK
jgi:biotin carboxyl carrier protein